MTPRRWSWLGGALLVLATVQTPLARAQGDDDDAPDTTPGTTQADSPAQRLSSAARDGDIEAVKKLLAQGVPIDSRGAGEHTALMAAAAYGEMEMVKFLLSRGADPTLRDAGGRTAAVRARNTGHADIAELLEASPAPPPRTPAAKPQTTTKPQPPRVSVKPTLIPRRGVASRPTKAPAKRASTTPARPAVLKIPALKPKRGYIIGRVIDEYGRPVPSFTIHCSGFEDGKLANYSATGYAMDTVDKEIKGSNGYYAIKVPSGAYRVSGWVRLPCDGKTFQIQMENRGPQKHDYDGLGLDKLRGGLVRNFVLHFSGKRPGASEATETTYIFAYYGARIDLNADIGKPPYENLGHGAVRNTYPAASTVTVKLVPQGRLINGRGAGQTIERRFRVDDAGKWTFNIRGIVIGAYRATAQVQTPDGAVVPLKLRTDSKEGAPWHDAVTVHFKPDDLGPVTMRDGAARFVLYLGTP